jgi:uncharacterized protein YaaQ
MKMIVMLAQEQHIPFLTKTLQPAGFRMTKISSTGGLLRRRVETLLLGVDDTQVDEALAAIRAAVNETGEPLPYFILDVARFERV